jgi:hypothetical protein
MIVAMFGPVNRKAYQEMVISKEFAPFICQQGSIGLKRIFDGFTGTIFFLQFKDFDKEIHSPHDRFPAMPCKKNVPVSLSKDVTGDKEFENVVAHAILVRIVGVEFLFFEVITIPAIKITDGTNGLRHNVVADLRWIVLDIHDVT